MGSCTWENGAERLPREGQRKMELGCGRQQCELWAPRAHERYFAVHVGPWGMQRARQTSFSASSIPHIILMFAHGYVTIVWPLPGGIKHEEQSYRTATCLILMFGIPFCYSTSSSSNWQMVLTVFPVRCHTSASRRRWEGKIGGIQLKNLIRP